MISWALALTLFLGALLLHLEIARRDLEAPPLPDPYRGERIRNGESLDPDNETAPNPRFPGETGSAAVIASQSRRFFW